MVSCMPGRNRGLSAKSWKLVHGAIEMAYAVPPNIFGILWDFYSQSSAQNLHSIIMTVPFEDRVSSLILSIPRADAVQFGYQFNLEMIFNPNAYLGVMNFTSTDNASKEHPTGT